MTLTTRVRQVYISFLISAVLACFNGLMNILTGKQEWLSLVLFVLFALIALIALTYSAMEFAITKEPSDLWKVGFLGLFGLVGLIPGLGYAFALFALFVFFGTRQYF